jgi:hypothetical protein
VREITRGLGADVILDVTPPKLTSACRMRRAWRNSVVGRGRSCPSGYRQALIG